MSMFNGQSGTLEEVGRKLDVSPRTLDDCVRQGIHPPERGRNADGDLLWDSWEWEELIIDAQIPTEPYAGFPEDV